MAKAIIRPENGAAFHLLALLALPALAPSFLGCSANDSGVSVEAGSQQNAAGRSGAAGSGAGLGGAAAVGVAGAHGVSGATGAAGASGSGGFAFSAAGGTNSTSSGGASPATGGAAGTSAGGASAGGASAGGRTGAGGAAGAAGASPAFTQVSAILGKNCGIAGCHADKETPHFVPGPALYGDITAPNTVLAECNYTKLVQASDPTKSALVLLMNRKCGTFTMPPTCHSTPCIAAADLKIISDWIQAGAQP